MSGAAKRRFQRGFQRRFSELQTRNRSSDPSQCTFKISNDNENGKDSRTILWRTGTGSRRHRSVPLRDFFLRYGGSSPEIKTTKRHHSLSIPSQPSRRTPANSVLDVNRGEPGLQWRSGLREPKRVPAGEQSTTHSLFVDNIPKRLPLTWLQKLFNRCGVVVDIFISTKNRSNNAARFGFVRYGSVQEARTAIATFNGLSVQGMKLLVSMARYEKGGAPASNRYLPERRKTGEVKKIWYPALRDDRSYRDVAQGLKNKIEELESVVAQKAATIPVLHSLMVDENVDVQKMLGRAAIAEKTDVLQLPQIRTELSAFQANINGIFYLSPTKVLLVFDTTNDAIVAMNKDSLLWNMFDDVRLWSEGEFFDDRLVWVECIGIHPLCWSNQNLKLIGEKWGPVLRIENKLQGVHSITSARLLLRTKAQNKIDNRIKLIFEHSTCDVWVKELYGYYGETGDCDNETLTSPTPIDLDGVLSKPQNRTEPLCFPDPLVQELCHSTINKDVQVWVDPMVWNENIEWMSAVNPNPCLNRNSPMSTPMSTTRPSRPRGRPRKHPYQHNQPEIPSHGILEARKTWETAQLLGISSYEEETVLSGLRKSKRILILEGKDE